MAIVGCLNKDGKVVRVEYNPKTGISKCTNPRCGEEFCLKDDRSTHHALISRVVVVACPLTLDISAENARGKRGRAAAVTAVLSQ